MVVGEAGRASLLTWLREREWGKFRPEFPLVSLFSFLVVVLLVSLIPSAKTLTALKARTELAVLLGSNADDMGMTFEKVWVERAVSIDGLSSDFAGKCVEGLTIAGDTGELHVQRLLEDQSTLVISSEDQSRSFFSVGDGDRSEIAGPFYLHIRGSQHPSQVCRSSAPIRIPVRGRVQIGAEGFDVGRLLAGTLTVYGRVEPWLLTRVLAAPDDREDSIIYEASELTLPAGSRVGSDLSKGQMSSQDNDWTGWLEADLDDELQGFEVHLQTQADDVLVWNQASDKNAPDKISISLSAQLVGDPYLQQLIGILTAFFALLAIIANRVPTRPE